ncbi:MAG TPA: hypothetical protein VII40_17070 [Xanthobacteraceae bacterium]
MTDSSGGFARLVVISTNLVCGRSFGDDVDAAVADRDRIAGETHLGMAEMTAGTHVELEPVPGTDDIERARTLVDAEAAAVGVEALLGSLHQLSLADRPALVRALVAPRIERAVHAEDADLYIVVDDDSAPTVRYFVLGRDKDFPHAAILAELAAPRHYALRTAEPPALPLGRACTITCHRRFDETPWGCA